MIICAVCRSTGNDLDVIVDCATALRNEDVEVVRARCSALFGKAVSVLPFDTELEFGLDPGALTPIASLVIAVAGLCVQIRREMKAANSAKGWTSERFQTVMRTELLRHGVIEFNAPEVENFQSLLTRDARPCRVRVQDAKTGAQISLYVFSDGEVYTVRPEDP